MKCSDKKVMPITAMKSKMGMVRPHFGPESAAMEKAEAKNPAYTKTASAKEEKAEKKPFKKLKK